VRPYQKKKEKEGGKEGRKEGRKERRKEIEEYTNIIDFLCISPDTFQIIILTRGSVDITTHR
jgi:hypothetical protein